MAWPVCRIYGHLFCSRSLTTPWCLYHCAGDNVRAASQVPSEADTAGSAISPMFAARSEPSCTYTGDACRLLECQVGDGESRVTSIVVRRRPELSPPGFRPTIGDQRDRGDQTERGDRRANGDDGARNTWRTLSASVSDVNGFTMLSQLRALHQRHHHIRNQQASHRLVGGRAPRLENGKRVYREPS